MLWLAQYHYILVHFPIALIITAALAELIMAIRKNAPLNHTVNFLLIAAALFTIPTILTGLLLGESGVVGATSHQLLELHEAFAYTTLAFALVTVFLRYWLGRRLVYFASLALLVLFVAITAHFGGEMAFGPLSYWP